MSDYFLYATVITTFVFAYMWYTEKKKHFTTKVELDIIKSTGRLGSINANLEQNREAFRAARDKFHATLHPMEPIPDFMLEHVTGPSERAVTPIRPGAVTKDSFDTGLSNSPSVGPSTDNRKQ